MQPVVVAFPPMGQLNTPYAALPVLAGSLRAAGEAVCLQDYSLELLLRILEPAVLEALLEQAIERDPSPAYAGFLAEAPRWAALMPRLLDVLRGRDPGLARLVLGALPAGGPRLAAALRDGDIFPAAAVQERARYRATLVLEDLADLLASTVAPGFGLTRYQPQVGESASTFAPVRAAVEDRSDALAPLLDTLLAELMPSDPLLVAITCPFPGNLVGALRIGRWLKRHRPGCTVALGGGFPSTELRELTDPGIFAYVDAIVLDDGEEPLRRLVARARGTPAALLRTLVKTGRRVVHHAGEAAGTDGDLRHGERPAPSYDGIALGRYLDLVDSANPMHRLWNEGRWLKLAAAHGCYWKRCAFCDVSLPYIRDYQPAKATMLADRMERLMDETGHAGFHFTDEAAPPALLLGLSLELLRRGRPAAWWGNLRFDPYFTPDRCRVLAAAGCIAVTGGLEVAHDRLLARIAKGVTVGQAARVGRAFADAGVLVHAYLMYGFPGETAQDSADAAETVRQLLQAGCLHSGFWHRFTVTAHSPVGRDPTAYGVTITGPDFAGFARNNLTHVEPGAPDREALGEHLAAIMQGWLAGRDLDTPLAELLPAHWPVPAVPADFVRRELNEASAPRPADRAVWLGGGCSIDGRRLQVTDTAAQVREFSLPAARREAWLHLLESADPRGPTWSGQAPVLGPLANDALAQELRPLGLALV